MIGGIENRKPTHDFPLSINIKCCSISHLIVCLAVISIPNYLPKGVEYGTNRNFDPTFLCIFHTSVGLLLLWNIVHKVQQKEGKSKQTNETNTRNANRRNYVAKKLIMTLRSSYKNEKELEKPKCSSLVSKTSKRKRAVSNSVSVKQCLNWHRQIHNYLKAQY